MSPLRPAWPGANLLLALRDPLALVSRMATVGDDVVSANIGPRTLYLLREPALIRQLLAYTGNALRKERALRLARLVLGEGLLTSEGERHREARRRLRPVFERQRLGGYGTVVLEQAGAVVGRWRDGERIDPYEEMRRFALNATARALFGRTFDDATPAVVAAVEAGIRGFDRHRSPFAALLNRLPVPGTLRLRRARETLLAATAELVDRGDGPLAVALRAHPNRRQALDEALVILLAGHETTAVALAWCCLLVADHPAVERRLHEEVESVAEDGGLKADDCQRLRYTRQVVAEAMRLYPPVWAISREAVAPLEIGSHRFPRNAVLMVSPWALHRDPRFWPDPLRFDPDRFVDPHRIAPFTYVPFSGGVRGCIGEGVAWTEAVLALATVTHACRLERTSAAPVLMSASISLRPTLQLEVRRRMVAAPARSTVARPPSETISITEVGGAADLRAFIDLPYRLYAHDPNWVPPLRLGERRRWSARHNPALRTRWTCRFLAHRAGKVVGRIAAIEDAEFAARWAPGTGFFGFFETVDDEDVARALLIAAESALRERSASRILGPVNLSTHDEVGLLVDGFDRPPMILDPYNPPCYPALLRCAGYEEERGYQAHEWRPALVPSPLIRRALARASASGGGLRVRATAQHRWNDDVTLLHGLYNACFADLWGFVPMGSEEMRARAAEFRPFYRPELVLFAEHEGEAVGFALALPDINRALTHARGRLLPFGWLRLLRAAQRIDQARVLLLGVRPEWRGRGVAALLAAAMADAGRGLGITSAELSLVQSDNRSIRTVIEGFAARRVKRFALFARELGP